MVTSRSLGDVMISTLAWHVIDVGSTLGLGAIFPIFITRAAALPHFPVITSGQTHSTRRSEKGRQDGGQTKMQQDIIFEWTGLEFRNSQRALENRANEEIWLQS